MNRMTLNTRIGADGVLRVTIPVGKAEADREVQLVIEPLVPELQSSRDYLEFLRATAGAWQGDFERPVQGDYEVRDPF